MTVAQLWTRRLWGGLAAAAFVPAVVVAALAVVLTGGFGGLRALGQAVDGPLLPTGTSRSTAVGAAAAPIRGSVLASLGAPGTAAAAARPTAVTSVASVHSSGAGSSLQPLQSARPGAPGRSTQSAARGRGGVRAPGSAQPPPRRQQTVIDGIVGTAAGVTSRLPAPVGGPATKTLLQAGSLADQILPPPPHGTP